MSNQNKEHRFLRFLSFGIVFSFFSFMSFKVFFPASPSSADTSASIAASTDILPTSEGVTATGSIDVYVTTNSLSGYDLRMYSSSGTTSMTNINSAVSASIAPTTGGSTLSNNTWGYQSNYVPGSWVAVGDGADNAKPLTNPTSSPNATLCDLTDIANCESNSYDTTTVTFGAKITDSLPAGRYTNDVVFTAIAKVPYVKTAYTIAYNKNSQDASGTVPSSIAVHPGGAVTFSNGSTLTPPEGKVLAGWALKADGSYPSTLYTSETTGLTIEDLIEDAIIAGQNVSENQPGTITLYAVWADPPTMQTFSCASLAEGESITLADERDGSEYTVKKFGTGSDTECWMTSNLKLGYDKGYTLTSDDTNIPDSTTYYLPQAGYRGSVTSSSTLTSTNAATFDPSTAVSEAHVQYRAAGTTDNDSGNPVPEDTGYYNYPAASLGYSYYNGGASSGETPRDICPKGWQLPRGSSTSTHSFYWLDRALGGTGANRTDTTTRDKFLNQASFGYTGNYLTSGYLTSTLYNVGSYGIWWSSTVSNSSNAYRLNLGSNGGVNPQDNGVKNAGYSIRCVSTQ